ncbi:MAG: DnaJ domain-containing protein [Nitratireductor sp.]|nr:DnaJ domain-containing protein [Nitratireductor sp.]
MFETRPRRTKVRIEAELFLDDGSHILCRIGVGQGERLSDALNDDRQFLPVETMQGHVTILRKSTISRAVQLDQQIDEANATDPFEVLGIARNVSDEELNHAYRSLCHANHPDKLLAAGMSQQFVEMATSKMARINDAYERIRSLRKQEQARHEQQPETAA